MNCHVQVNGGSPSKGNRLHSSEEEGPSNKSAGQTADNHTQNEELTHFQNPVYFSNIITNFYVLLTLYLSITLVNDQLDAQLFYNTFITVLYMFRATPCSSSGGQIVLIQHLV